MESATAKFSDSVYTCAKCQDLEWIVTVRGAKQCDCLQAKLRVRLLDRIPAEYRGFDLATIRPDTNRHEGQASLVPALQSAADTSILLCGRVGCGKSLFGWLLYKRAVEDGRPAIAAPLAELMSEYRRYECGDDKLPSVLSADLRSDKRRWLIFLDEFDKARATEFATEQLFLLMDAIYAGHHQLVVTSNLSKDDLRAHWSKASEQYGVSIMRRLLELDGMARKEMF
jgi:DNA replication protein DnaC